MRVCWLCWATRHPSQLLTPLRYPHPTHPTQRHLSRFWNKAFLEANGLTPRPGVEDDMELSFV